MKTNQGFTLVEVIIAVFITAIVITFGYSMWNMFMDSYQLDNEASQSIEEVDRILRTLTNEIKEARDGENGAYPLAETSDNQIIFYSDINGDLSTDRVRYTYQNHQLTKGVTVATGTPPSYDANNEVETIISTNIANQAGEPLFTYYNRDWPKDIVNNPLSGSQRLLYTRFIRISVVIDTIGNFAAEPVRLTDGVQLRNLKDNL